MGSTMLPDIFTRFQTEKRRFQKVTGVDCFKMEQEQGVNTHSGQQHGLPGAREYAVPGGGSFETAGQRDTTAMGRTEVPADVVMR